MIKKTIMINWVDNRSRIIEKKLLSSKGKSLSFISISRILTENAVLEIRPDLGTMIINIDRFKKNQANFLKNNK